NGQVVQIECDYDFPYSWSPARLSSICALIDGEKKEGQQLCLDAKFLRGKSAGEYQQRGKFVHKGDNIILVDGENSGEVFTVPCDGYMGSTFKQLWVSSVMHLPYVLNFILFYKELLRKSKRGAAIPHLNKEIFYSLIIGIPPYQEQVKIVNKINEVCSKIKG
ncbi:restriction endonuclease subunit S, partial [Alistipes intestinihominis]